MVRYIAKFQTNLLLSVSSTNDRGATAVEYGLIVAAVIGLALFALPALHVALISLFDQSTAAVVVVP